MVRFSESVTYNAADDIDDNGDNVEWHSFLALESPHPYGVLPAGNRFLLTESALPTGKDTSSDDQKQVDNKKSCLGRLRDEIWLSILGFLDGASLGNTVQSCHFFYVAGHQPELWRDLVLRKLQRENLVLDAVGNSWKDTYVMLFNRHDSCSSSSQFVESKPMKIPGIYSDDLYRLHSCRSFAIPPAWLREPNANFNASGNAKQPRHCTGKNAVPRVPAKDMTCEEFVKKYENPNQPVVLSGAAKTWKAFRDWQDPAYLREHTNGRTFRATSGMAPLPANFTLEAFQTYCSNPNLEEGPLYLFDRAALKPDSPLQQDYYVDMQQSCPFFDPARTMMRGDTGNNTDKDDNNNNNNNNNGYFVGHDLFQVLGEGRRPDHTWAIIGGNHSGSVFHIDPNCTHAWNAAICGRKRWIFYPPGVTPPGVHPSADGDSVALPLSVGEWILTFWREHQHAKATAPLSRRPLECTAFPGDVIFVPHGWWHMVINLDRVNVAITHNYVSRSNLGNVLRFLKCKEDQISGCRDRVDSVKPDKLHATFSTALQDQFGEETGWLAQAQQQAASHWTCKAWKNDDLEDRHAVGGDSKRRRVNTNEKQSLEDKNAPGNNIMLKAKTSSGAELGDAPFSFSFL